MEWEIIDKGDYYLPKTDRWIMDTFGLNAERAMYYQMIINKGYICWSQEWMAEVLGCSRDKIKETLKLFCDMEILTKRTINVSEKGVRQRTVYVALYTREGRRSDKEVEALLKQGVHKLCVEYSSGKKYKKKGK